MNGEQQNKELIYIGDPMCSWCYGFAPVIQALHGKFGNDLAMRIVVGGLRIGPENIVDEKRLSFLREHWQEVAARTGQPFGYDILDNTGWLYDTERACRAVVVVRRLDPAKLFAYFGAIQTNFYLNNRDPEPVDTYADEAENFGIDRQAFVDAYESAEIIDETMRDFTWSAQIGIRGFPSVLVREGDKLAALTLGYQPLEALEGPLQTWIGREAPAAVN